MFGKVASDVLGLSDVGSVISPADYDKVDADDYILHEDGEKIYFLIKSKSDEYCFTNKALIHLDGTSATSKKRVLRRYDYYLNKIEGVALETAGNIDLDVEIHFTIGSVHYSIDVHKKYMEQLKDLYKSLLKIAEITHDNEIMMNYAKQSLEVSSSLLKTYRSGENDVIDQFQTLNQLVFDWMVQAKIKYHIKDFGFVFEKFINN